MAKMLLHVCCGPCACACVPRLKAEGHDVTLLFANSNIDTREEFEKRLGEAKKLAKVDGVEIVALPYDHADWLRNVAAGYEPEPEQGERCARCFRYNLTQAATYAKAHGFDRFTTSLTVSPHKVSATIFSAAADAEKAATDLRTNPQNPPSAPHFVPYDFKRHGGYDVSVTRAAELGLYRQSYCGCEFSKARWNFHHKRETESTNLDAREGRHRDVFTADFQTAGRGRLDHAWSSPPGTNLLMSVVLAVDGLAPEQVATLPLVAGLAVARALTGLREKGAGENVAHRLRGRVAVKWPNDVLVDGRKIAGILCERHGDNVIVGIGVNVRQREWPAELAGRATSVLEATGLSLKTVRVRNAVLGELGKWYGIWREKGFSSVYHELAALDALKGQSLTVRQTDGDASPISGRSGGIRPDGSLDVGGRAVYAGEAVRTARVRAAPTARL